MPKILCKAVACALMVVLVPALGAQMQFDVASVKENQSGTAGGTLRFVPDGGMRAVNMPARTLITVAHSLEPYQIVDLPDWGRDLKYDLDARPATKATREESLQMLRSLLTERFKLTFRREERQIDGYSMARARANGLGPSMRPATVVCSGPVPPQRCLEARIGSDTMKIIGAPMETLVRMIVSKVGAPVRDDTGLTGVFDFDLAWTDEMVPGGDRPSIYTALQEQLGLKLERRRVAAETFIVERIERPAPD